MPDNGYYSWDPTAPLNNGNSDAAINWVENQAPSTVNGSARAMMQREAQRLIDTGYPTAGGSADALTLTPLNVLTSYTSGMVYTFTAASTNTTNATLNISGVGIKAIRKISGGVDVALTAGDIAAASRYQVVYDSTANAAAGAWILTGSSGFNGTLTSTDAGAAAAPILTLYRDSATPATNDILGQLLFNGEDSAGNTQEYASIQPVIVSPTSTTEASTLDLYTQKAGSRVLSLSLAGNVASATNFAQGYTTTATAAGTTTLTVSSTQQQYFTGTSTQTVVLPVTSTLTLGHSFRIVNNSTGGAVTVQSSGANNIVVLPQGSTVVVTCILTSGTTAASWDAKTALIGGLVSLIPATAISAVASLGIVLTGYTAYAGVQIDLMNFIPATDNVELWCRTSTNGGSSYDSGASDYAYANTQGYAGNSTVNGAQRSTGDTKMVINGSIGNLATEGNSATINLVGQTSTTMRGRLRWTQEGVDLNGQLNHGIGSGRRLAAADIDAIQFFFSSGNIASGVYAVRGIV